MSLALLALSFAAAVIRGWLVMRWAVDREIWIRIIQKTLASDRARAQKLCSAVGSPIGEAMKAAIVQSGSLPADGSAETAIREAYDVALAPMQLLSTTRLLSVVALLLAGFGCFLAWPVGELGTVHFGGALAVLAITAWAELKATNVLGTGPLAIEAVMPLLLQREPSDAPYRAPAPEPPHLAGPHLRVYRAGALVGEIALDNPVIKIGRLSSAHVYLEHESVARMHAVLEHDGDQWTIIDLGADGGTRVDGERVNKASLNSGDRVGIGPFELELVLGAAPPVSIPPRAMPTDALFFGFDGRAPDLFFEAIAEVLREESLQLEARVHTRDDAPHAVVSLWGDRPTLERARELIATRGDRMYRRFETPREQIVPDATYGPETRLHAVLLDDLSSRTPDRTSR